MLQALRYSFDEAAASLWRGRRSAILSVLTSAVALFVLGVVLLATSNLRRLADDWSRSAEMSVYLADDVAAADRAAVELALTPDDLVASYSFISKAEALARFKETFADLAPTVESLEGNPLPASFEVRLRTTNSPEPKVEELATKLRGLAGVADVRYDRQWLDRLLSWIGALRTVGLGFAIFLVVAASLTIANVIRLALFARRDEIDIMQLIGAPTAYVRGPFIAEGFLQGGLAAAVALLVLGATYFVISSRYLGGTTTFDVSGVGFLSPGLALLLVLGGMSVGCVGGLIASRRT